MGDLATLSQTEVLNQEILRKKEERLVRDLQVYKVRIGFLLASVPKIQKLVF